MISNFLKVCLVILSSSVIECSKYVKICTQEEAFLFTEIIKSTILKYVPKEMTVTAVIPNKQFFFG